MAEFLAALPAILAALPELIKLLVKAAKYFERNGKLVGKEKLEALFDEHETATTVDEKTASARRISGGINRITK